MEKYNSFKEIDIYLELFKKTHIEKPYKLDRMYDLMKFLGNPEKKLRIIHVAGTSGKTSTSYYIASLLSLSGYKTGLSVSPHIDNISERLQIDLKNFNQTSYCKIFNEFNELISQFKSKINYYEFLVAMAYWYFDKQKVDYAIIEVGVGGLLDGTNIADNTNKICVITDIGIDHTKLLGNTIEEITKQKAGIIKAHNQVFTYSKIRTIDKIIKDIANSQHASVDFIKPNQKSILKLNNLQSRNFELAKHVTNYILSNEGKAGLDASQIRQASQITIPGRLEIIKIRNKVIILDGAHNSQKIEGLVATIAKLYPSKSKKVLIALSTEIKSKNIDILKSINNLTPFLIITNLSTLSLEELSDKYSKYLDRLNFSEVSFVCDANNALKSLLNSDEDILIITGSFYLIKQLRKSLIRAS